MRNAIYIVLTVLFILSCKGKKEHDQVTGGAYYTCPMHPTVRSDRPGACPICNMDLIRVEEQKPKAGHEDHEGNYMILTKHQQLVAGIETDTVRKRAINAQSRILGTVAVDEDQVQMISSRVTGRIEKLTIRSSGQYVEAGTPLYTIYSEELFADAKEYLGLLDKQQLLEGSDMMQKMLTASRNKLILWGMTDGQIKILEDDRRPNPSITFEAPRSGYVTNVSVSEGMYVEEGTPLLTLANLGTVWVEVQLYANEVATNAGETWLVYTGPGQSESIAGKVIYNNPVVEENRKIYLVRIRVPNGGGHFVPGMMVFVSPQQSSATYLTVPKSVVLLEKMKTAWVKTDEETFEQRMVETGREDKNFVEILSGLKEGEVVVSSGAYLISSEFILKRGTAKRHNH